MCCFIYPRVSCEVSPVCVFLYWSSITCKCVLAVVLSEEWVTGPARERKTVLLRLKTTQPFFWLCVCVHYTSVCASEARSVMLACVFNKRLRRSVCVKVDVPQPKVFRRFTDPLTFRLIVVPCVFTVFVWGDFSFTFLGISLTSHWAFQLFLSRENLGAEHSAIPFCSHHATVW